MSELGRTDMPAFEQDSLPAPVQLAVYAAYGLALALLFFGLIGFWDDYLKLAKQNPKGLIPRWKYTWQSVVGLAAAVFLFYTAKTPAETSA